MNQRQWAQAWPRQPHGFDAIREVYRGTEQDIYRGDCFRRGGRSGCSSGLLTGARCRRPGSTGCTSGRGGPLAEAERTVDELTTVAGKPVVVEGHRDGYAGRLGGGDQSERQAAEVMNVDPVRLRSVQQLIPEIQAESALPGRLPGQRWWLKEAPARDAISLRGFQAGSKSFPGRDDGRWVPCAIQRLTQRIHVHPGPAHAFWRPAVQDLNQAHSPASSVTSERYIASVASICALRRGGGRGVGMGSVSARCIARTSAAGSSGSKRIPSTPSSTSSGNPPLRGAMTGHPAARASRAMSGAFSCHLGARTRARASESSACTADRSSTGPIGCPFAAAASRTGPWIRRAVPSSGTAARQAATTRSVPLWWAMVPR